MTVGPSRARQNPELPGHTVDETPELDEHAAHHPLTQGAPKMGMFKQMKDLKKLTEAAPGMIN